MTLIVFTFFLLALTAVILRFPREIFTTMLWEQPAPDERKDTILVIEMGSDNSFPQLWRSVGSFIERYSGKNIQILPFREVTTSKVDEISPIAAVLTGYHQELSSYVLREMEHLFHFLTATTLPVFSICGGFQFLCMAYGSRIVEMGFQEKGCMRIRVTADDELFKGLPPVVEVYNWHRLMIDRVPDDFNILAQNDACVQAVRHRCRPIYGVQFHPEFNSGKNPHGTAVMENFLSIVMQEAEKRDNRRQNGASEDLCAPDRT